MTHSTLVARRRETTRRQAKRLSEKLGLPQTAAMGILARALYRCAGSNDLLARLDSQAPEKHIELLTALPLSIEARTYFYEVRRDLAKSLSQHILTNMNLVGLLDLVQDVFALGSAPTTLADILSTLTFSPWQSSGIGPDPWAVLEAEAVINGTSLRLVATRTYMPNYYAFTPDDINPEFAVPFGGKLKIIWTDPDSWRQAALDYLNDDDAEEIQLPQVVMTAAMAKHQHWFEASLGACGICGEYGQHDEDFIPHIIENQGCYIVFGFPHRLANLPERENQNNVTLLPDETSKRQVALLDGTPVCLEWIAFDPATQKHLGEFDEYFDSLRIGLLRNELLYTTPLQDGTPGILCMQPSTDFDIGQALKVDFSNEGDEIAFVMKTNNPSLTSVLLEKVAVRDLMVFGSKEHPRYFTKILTPPSHEPPSLCLSLNMIGPDFCSGANLVLGTTSTKVDSGWRLLVEIERKLLTLQDKLGKNATETAINHGLVLRHPVAFKEALQQPPSRCQNLSCPPDDVVKLLVDRLRGPFRFSYTTYRRDNF